METWKHFLLFCKGSKSEEILSLKVLNVRSHKSLKLFFLHLCIKVYIVEAKTLISAC